jgi:hypothetical protein
MQPMGAVRRVLMCALSAGWVIPVWVSVAIFSSTVVDVLRFVAFGGQGYPSGTPGSGRVVTSFPVEEFAIGLSALLFVLGCIWLVAVIVFWVWRLTSGSASPHEPSAQASPLAE